MKALTSKMMASSKKLGGVIDKASANVMKVNKGKKMGKSVKC